MCRATDVDFAKKFWQASYGILLPRYGAAQDIVMSPCKKEEVPNEGSAITQLFTRLSIPLKYCSVSCGVVTRNTIAYRQQTNMFGSFFLILCFSFFTIKS